MSILLQSGRIITAHEDYVADILIDGGRIAAIGSSLDAAADEVIDVSGKYVIPGGIDVHTHLDMPMGGFSSSDDFETGTRAAAFGGTTCIIDFANQSRGRSLRATFDEWMTRGRKSTLDFGLHLTITDLRPDYREEMKWLVEQGVTSFKVFTAYPGRLMLDDADIFCVLRESAALGALVMVHAENGTVIDLLVHEAIAAGKREPIYHALTRPPLTEAEAVHRMITLARLARSPIYIVHVSCADALREISRARKEGCSVYGETCPHYLFLDEDDLRRPGFEGAKFVLTPPLREKGNQEKLWRGLLDRTLDVVSTDHCPFNFKGEKQLGRNDFTKIPNGGPGIEHRMQLLFHGGVNQKRLSLQRWIEVTSTAPAKLFGLYPRKGAIAIGSDADVVIWNAEQEQTLSATRHHMRVDYSLYEGTVVRGNAETVVAHGAVIVQNGKWRGTPGAGSFVRRTTLT